MIKQLLGFRSKKKGTIVGDLAKTDEVMSKWDQEREEDRRIRNEEHAAIMAYHAQIKDLNTQAFEHNREIHERNTIRFNQDQELFEIEKSNKAAYQGYLDRLAKAQERMADASERQAVAWEKIANHIDDIVRHESQ